MSHKKDPADVYRPQMEQAAAAAAPVSPFTAEVEKYNQGLWDMYTGKTKFDLSKMPNANALMPMYDQAKARSDQGRIGKGLQYGGGPGAQGYNANLIASMDEQNQSERERDAAGQLEQRVADTFSGIGGKMAGMGDAEQQRRNDIWDRYQKQYGREINRPKQTPWWQTALAGGLGVAGAFAGRPSGGG